MKRTSISGFRSGLLGSSALALLASTALPAIAQDQADQNDDAALDVEEIVVTGSRIKRSNLTAPTPVTIVDAERITLSGETSIGQLLSELPSIGNTFTNANSSRFIGTAGLNLLDLRDLGTDRTLVLVDGRRHVGSNPGSAAVDINTIPTDLVDRIEVITGGASALYGADAVTGVVNFVLKDDFQGLKVRGQYGRGEDGGYEDYFTSATVGSNFADGRGNAVLSIEWAEQSRLELTDRPELGVNTRQVRNTDAVQDAFNTPSEFDEVIIENAGLSFLTDGGLFFSPLDGRPFVFDQDGSVRPQNLGPSGGLPGFECFDCDFLDLDQTTQLQPLVQRFSVNAITHYDLHEYVTFFAEAKFVNTQTQSEGQPAFNFFGSGIPIRSDNAFVDGDLADIFAQSGADSITVNRFNMDAGRRGEFNERDTFRIVTGFEGSFEDYFDYELYYTFGRTNRGLKATNNRINDRFLASTDAVALSQEDVEAIGGSTLIPDASVGQIVCRSTLQAATGEDPTLPGGGNADSFIADGCVPTSIFGDGAINQEAAEYFNVTATRLDDLEQHVVSGYLTGDSAPLFELPAGPIGWAVGGEWREESSSSNPAPIDAIGITFGNALNPLDGGFNVKEGFGEVTIPILKDLPFAQDLSLDGALRLSDYSTIGSTTTWKVGANWTLTEDFRVRSTYSEAVRAPNIGELFDPLSQNFFNVDDPCSASEIAELPQDDPRRAARERNCAALGIPANFESQVDDATLPGQSGGNPNLQEETSESLTIGAVFTPRWTPNLAITLDYFDIEISNAIQAVSAQDILDRCVESESIDNQFCGQVTRDPNSNEIVNIVSSQLNIAATQVEGLDFEVNYNLELSDVGLEDFGNLRFRFLGTHYFDLTQFPFEDDPDDPDPELKELGIPKTSFNANVTWFWENISFNYELRWIGSQFTVEFEDFQADPVQVFPFKTGDVFYHDIRAEYQLNQNVSFFAGIDNLASKEPPAFLSGAGGGSAIFDNIGRFIYGGAEFNF